MCSHCSCGQPTPTLSPVAAPSVRRTLELHHNLLHRNDTLAAANRERFAAAGLLVLNVLSAPGAGKTALLERLARQWSGGPVGVIVGDLATDNDARRLRAAGARAVQIQTGDLCHLEASLVGRAFDQLDTSGMALLLIENVGNLVCPTAFDLGERLRLVLLSVTEGEDKPLKYPAMFHTADAVVINKTDLAEAVGFDRRAALAALAAVAPQARIFEVSARTGEGVDALLHWFSHHRQPLPA
jgi:hydrogenase nickel incorporation protein HypB